MIGCNELRRCAYATDRLAVAEWQLSELERDLPGVVCDVLTTATTRFLPSLWQGDYTVESAEEWIRERSEDSNLVIFLALEIESGEALGFLFVNVFRDVDAEDDPLVNIGYVLAESKWGQGFATELVRGFVGWCRNQPWILGLVAGVAREHNLSASVLLKNEFLRQDDLVFNDDVAYLLPLRNLS